MRFFLFITIVISVSTLVQGQITFQEPSRLEPNSPDRYSNRRPYIRSGSYFGRNPPREQVYREVNPEWSAFVERNAFDFRRSDHFRPPTYNYHALPRTQQHRRWMRVR